MPAPRGNQNSKGKGRKSAFREMADAKALWEKWTTPGIQGEVLSRMGTGKETLEDIFLALGFKENVKVLCAIFNKLYATQTDIKSGGKILQITGMKIVDERGK